MGGGLVADAVPPTLLAPVADMVLASGDFGTIGTRSMDPPPPLDCVVDLVQYLVGQGVCIDTMITL